MVERKLEKMRTLLHPMGRVAVAFSGGVDSVFVLKVALDTLGFRNVVAVTAKSASLAEHEYRDAVRIARQLQAEHVVLDSHETEDPRYLANSTHRCYFCKSELYVQLDRFIAERGFDCVVNGTNADDVGDWRPGLKAASEHGVRSPALEAGLTKDEIRLLSRRMGLPSWEKPATPCLSSRVPYGTVITVELLKQVEAAEAALRELGFSGFRVRHHQTVARIELPEAQIGRALDPVMRAKIIEAVKAAGYTYVTLDLGGFKSGSLNTHTG